MNDPYESIDNQVDLRIGQRVRARRMEIGMSQEALAGLLGVTFQQVQKYEKGVNRISASRLYFLAKALNVPVSAFYEGVAVAVPGVAEEVQSSSVADTLATPEGVQLVMLFHTIRNPRVRRRVVELVRALADEEAEDPTYPTADGDDDGADHGR
jgi:transcriptional regulator with XRE-family HTH domain